MLPAALCVGGIRLIVTFPTCWDGKNVDSPDYKSHVAYTKESKVNDVGFTGMCLKSYLIVIL